MELNEIKTVKISELYEMVKNGEGTFDISTPDGFAPIGNVYLKKNKICYKMTLENGGEYIIPEKQCNFQKFDDLYVNIEDFKTEEQIIEHFKEWRDLFIPELSNAEIKYEYKGK